MSLVRFQQAPLQKPSRNREGFFGLNEFCDDITIMKTVRVLNDNKVKLLISPSSDLPCIKTKPLTPYKAKVLENVKQAVDELNLVLSGHILAGNAEDFLNEL